MTNICTKPMYIKNKNVLLKDNMSPVPCGQCIGCRLQKASQWATRCIHEASLYEDNSFVTLTYSPAYLPEDSSIHKSHLKNFIRRLHVQYSEKEIRYYGCGEYGECCKNCGKSKQICYKVCGKWETSIGRPHYHILLFNHDFHDKEILQGASYKRLTSHFSSGPVCDLYRSPTLEKLWPFGYSTIGEVTIDSAGYVARYVMKKITGSQQKDHYNDKLPEFAKMSRTPGIGKPWLDRYFNDVYPKDYFHINGTKRRPPRYYDDQLKKIDRCLYNQIKKKRKEGIKDIDSLRLYQKRQHKKLITKTLKRNLPND